MSDFGDDDGTSNRFFERDFVIVNNQKNHIRVETMYYNL